MLAPAAVEARRMAVLEFRGTAVEAEGLAYLSRRVRGESLSNLGEGWEVMTRENMLVLIDASLGECVREGECDVETGRNIGADRVVSGEVVRFGGDLRLSLALYDTRTGRLLSTAEAAAPDERGVAERIAPAVARLMSARPPEPLDPVDPPPPPPPPRPPPSTTSGTLVVEGAPAGARVLILDADARPVGEARLPATATGLAGGRYRVVVERAGHRRYDRSHEVPAGGQTRIWVELRRDPFRR